ncbi:acylphosphatase [Apilactobacillus xinyiensis]|uniref:acylphosphatase n=1 Tax=Apilactobacillus xinyiensis TaxID=2841032 RepID=UPI001C7DDDE8|nr:acylphosphatase [Apilactobacillus xinyiensis]
MSKECITIIAQGKVQGVGFRAAIQNIANSLGITGNVQNLNDGSVKITAQGNDKKIQQLLKLIKNNPTPFCKVTKLLINSNEKNHNYSDFKIKI